MSFIGKVKKCLVQIVALILFIIIKIYIYYFPDDKYKYYLSVIGMLFIMIARWFNINNNKKSLIFYSGLIYITIPMIYWCRHIEYMDTLVLFIFITCFYNIFSFFLFKITDGLPIKTNRNYLKLITNTIIALLISYLNLRLKSLDKCPMSLCKDYLIISTLLCNITLLISNYLLYKISQIMEYKSIKELHSTESIFPTEGIVIKIANNLLFISYIYIIYVVILKLICEYVLI